MSYVTAEAACKLCGRKITLSCDPICPPDWADSFARMACCNRCYDFREASERCGTRIVNCCHILQSLRANGKKDPAREKQLSEALTWLTKSYCREAGKYYGAQNLWHQEFVDLLMAKPEASGRALNMMQADLRKQDSQYRATHPDP